MNTLHRILFPALLALFLFSSCRTMPHYTLRPANSTATDQFGTRTALTDRVVVGLWARDSVVDQIYCTVRVSNQSADTLAVQPEQFHYVFPNPDALPARTTTVKALNPEVMIAACKQETVDENDRYSRAQDTKGFFALIGAIFEVVAAVSEIGEDDCNRCNRKKHDCCCSSHSRRHSDNDDDKEDDEDEREHYRKLSAIRAEQRFWENTALRGTILYPGESVEGDVVFPLRTSGPSLEVRYSTQGDTLVFPFHIEKAQR